MRPSIGIDIVDVEDFKKRISKTKPLGKRIFTDYELDYCKNKGIEHLAARFAAKEAFKKASGISNLSWHDAEIRNLPSGKPVLKINEKIKNRLKINTAEVSLSHTKKQAIASVLIEQIK